MPTCAQLEESMRAISLAQERTKGRIRIDSVLPDYFAKYPKACMGGWGKKLMLIDPTGRVLPCHAAAVIPRIDFDKSVPCLFRKYGESRMRSGSLEVRNGCKSRAGAATAAPKILVDAGARRSYSPETRPQRIPYVRCRRDAN